MKLSRRENDVLQCIAVQCLTNKEAARALGISPRTVEDHRSNILKKMQVRNTAELARKVALGESNGTGNKMPVREILGALFSQTHAPAVPR